MAHALKAWSIWISGSVFVCYKVTRMLGISIPLFSFWCPLLLHIRFLSSDTSLGRLMLFAWLLFCMEDRKRKWLSLVLTASCKTYKCTMLIQARNINLCTNFPILTCRPVASRTYLPESLSAFSLCTFSISLSIENIASSHKPSLAYILYFKIL